MSARSILGAAFRRMPERWRVLGAMAAKRAAHEVREARAQMAATMTDLALQIDHLAGMAIGCGCMHDDPQACGASAGEEHCDCRCHGPLSGGGDA